MKIRIVNILALLALVVLTVGCATQSPYAGLAAAVSAINPKYADAASKLEKALSAAAKPGAPAKADEEAILRAAGYVPSRTAYFRGTECAEADFKVVEGWERIKIGGEILETKPEPAKPAPIDGIDLEALAVDIVDMLGSAEKAK